MTLLRVLAAAALLSGASVGRAAAFAPGEETVIQLRYLNLPTGEGRISVGQPAGDVWPVIFQAKTDGVAGLFDIREHLVSYWDATTRLTRGVDLRAYEVGDYKTESTRFDRANGKATIERHRKGARTVKTFEIPRDVHDLTSALMWLRLQPLQPGDRHELPVCSGTRQFTLVADVLGRETVETAAGTFTSVKVQVRTAFEGKFSTKRDTFVWFSDDSRHVLVRMSAEFAVGSVVATLKSYRPGTQVASASPPSGAPASAGD
jgi:hypothetical protein